ncbi:MAG: TIGR00341 family protein [Bacteroidetes bacterium]|nr:TIGR00341 family protein [Bacteroidota bacterium]
MNFLDKFRLADEREDIQTVIKNIHSSIDFKGTNLWILIFAIFIASLGLNVNSTAVIIGAMLVSPLMGPIIGLGFGMAINDLTLLKKSFFTFLFATTIGLVTSTVYFFLSPINEAHSEILARTTPNIYDVMIALFGGLAGILAMSSKMKGNVISGVAIATALMPPLCTAGYGLATLQFSFFLGAIYLFIINTVFIALATLVTTRILKFPYKQLPKKEDERKAKRVVWAVVIITILPSLYFGYDMVQQNKFLKRANLFIETEAKFPNDYLLKKNIDPKNKIMVLTYGGQIIEETEITSLKSKLSKYNLETAQLIIQQGFAYLADNKNNEQINQHTSILLEKDHIIQQLQTVADSLSTQNVLSKQIYRELKTQYSFIQSCILQQVINHNDTSQQVAWLAILHSTTTWNISDKKKIEDWLKVRLNIDEIKLFFE